MKPTTTHATATRVAKNTIAQIAALASTIVSKLLITIIIARLFGPERVGHFAFVMTFTLLFTFLASAGVTVALIREVAIHREQVDRYTGNALSLVILSSLCTLPLMYGVIILMGEAADIRQAILLTGLALAFDSLAQVFNGVFGGVERMELGALIIIVQEAAYFVIGGCVLWLELPFLWLFVAYVPSRLMGVVVGFILYRRLFSRWPRLRFDKQFIKSLARTSFPFAINMALGPVYVQIDIVMLTFYQSRAAIGIYEAAAGLFYRFNVFARMVNNALMPLMAREFEYNPAQARLYLGAATKYQVAFGIPLTVWCVGLAGWLIHLLYGPGFEISALIFSLLSTAIILRFLNNVLATALTAIGFQNYRSTAVALAALFNIGGNLYALPRYGIWGAAGMSLLTEILFFTTLYYWLDQRMSQPLASAGWLKLAGAGWVMATVFWLGRSLPVMAVIGLSGLAYLAALIGLHVFSTTELNFMLRTVRLHRFAPSCVQNLIL